MCNTLCILYNNNYVIFGKYYHECKMSIVFFEIIDMVIINILQGSSSKLTNVSGNSNELVVSPPQNSPDRSSTEPGPSNPMCPINIHPDNSELSKSFCIF